MNPANLPCLAAARPDVCVLANNHVLDFGRAGLAETLDSLRAAGLRTAGAGGDAAEAWRPARVTQRPPPSRRGSASRHGPRLLVFSVGLPSRGIPLDWAATADRSGIALASASSPATAAGLVARVRGARRAGDLVAVSIHWGSNWGYRVPPEHVRFAHALVDGGADLVHGHSSHHPRPPPSVAPHWYSRPSGPARHPPCRPRREAPFRPGTCVPAQAFAFLFAPALGPGTADLFSTHPQPGTPPGRTRRGHHRADGRADKRSRRPVQLKCDGWVATG
ncbi:hypothetical protein SLAVM298S_01341 [Streptomyces lavendulae subsp. lavendulae]